MITKLVKELKDNDQDFEFYPTTDEIIKVMLKDMKKMMPKHFEYEDKPIFLDIGAGNGKVLKAVKEWKPDYSNSDHWRCDNKHFDLWAIEKSQILMKELVKDALVVGADFHEQSLINLESSIAFCNPPYSEYKEWTNKIIRECNTKVIYLVIPERWKTNQDISASLKFRKADTKVIGSYKFDESEDRKARGTVDLIRIVNEVEGSDLFDSFFDETFGHLIEEHEEIKKKEEEEKEEFKKRTEEMVIHKGLISALVDAYDEERDNAQTDFSHAMAISPAVMAALGVQPESIKVVLTEKEAALRVKYWEHLINKMAAIRKRLTRNNRDSILERIKRTAKMDFNEKNIYAILIWVLEKANSYIDGQIVGVFDAMLNEASVEKYKSNERVFKDGDWRYNGRPEGEMTHVSLTYRIVLTWGGLDSDEWHCRLSEFGNNHLTDMLIVASALGYSCDPSDPRLLEGHVSQSSYWTSGKKQVFKDNTGKILFEAKAFKNRNIHIRMGQELAVKLNAAVGRIRGWIKSPKEAEKEMGKGAGEAFNINPYLGNVQLLLGSPKAA